MKQYSVPVYTISNDTDMDTVVCTSYAEGPESQYPRLWSFNKMDSYAGFLVPKVGVDVT